jgi:glycerol-3-phosphate acyltransferase PlsX
MRVAVDLVAAGRARAVVSAGNTGALMAMGHFVLGTVPGIDRPAIIAPFPTRQGRTYLLDLGASTQATPEQLLQFGFMGSVMAGDGPSGAPRVGLLNVGHEAIKGTPLVQAADVLLRASPLRYVGYVEGDAIFDGDVDVVVTDGFTGNVTLKALEGFSRFVASGVRAEFTSSFARRASALVAAAAIGGLKARFDARRYNGAGMAGLAGVVVKSHGGADATAFGYAVRQAITAARSDVPERIRQALAQQVA